MVRRGVEDVAVWVVRAPGRRRGALRAVLQRRVRARNVARTSVRMEVRHGRGGVAVCGNEDISTVEGEEDDRWVPFVGRVTGRAGGCDVHPLILVGRGRASGCVGKKSANSGRQGNSTGGRADRRHRRAWETSSNDHLDSVLPGVDCGPFELCKSVTQEGVLNVLLAVRDRGGPARDHAGWRARREVAWVAAVAMTNLSTLFAFGYNFNLLLDDHVLTYGRGLWYTLPRSSCASIVFRS